MKPELGWYVLTWEGLDAYEAIEHKRRQEIETLLTETGGRFIDLVVK